MKASALALLLFSSTAFATVVPEPPQVDAKSYAVIDFQSGALLASRDPDAQIEPASITKVLTVYIAFDYAKQGRIKLTDEALISEKAWRRGLGSNESRMFIQVGTRVKVEDLLRGVIVQSGNDASLALAEFLAGGETVFADVMNQYAAKLGMTNSHFVDASGMPDPKHYTTARDLTTLARALIRDFPEGYKIFSERDYTYNNIKQGNRNILLDMDPTVDGIKTGHTDAAGYCLLASANRSGRRLISAVMGTKGVKYRAQASLELLNYGFRFFDTVPLFGATKPVGSVRVWKGAEDQVSVGVPRELYFTVPHGDATKLVLTPQLAQQEIAPVEIGQSFGTVSVSLDGKELQKLPVVALKQVPKGTLTKQAIDQVRLWIGR
jgi:serine-type D-Ala-D-Ala carboxypeptidase (penicillin-binding protein 5/6)